ncbi:MULTISPECIES: copper resistance CopC family protein [unclassified Modestobacter]
MTPFPGPPSERRRRGAPGALLGLLGLLTALVLAVGTAPAQAHDGLVRSTPAAGAALSAAPAAVQLDFSGAPLPLGTQVLVTGPDGTVSAGAPEIQGASVVQALAADVPAGSYTVQWRSTSSDGHNVEGTYGFTVTPGAAPAAPVSAEPVAASADPGTPLVWLVAGALVLGALGTLVVSRLRRPA